MPVRYGCIRKLYTVSSQYKNCFYKNQVSRLPTMLPLALLSDAVVHCAPIIGDGQVVMAAVSRFGTISYFVALVGGEGISVLAVSLFVVRVN